MVSLKRKCSSLHGRRNAKQVLNQPLSCREITAATCDQPRTPDCRKQVRATFRLLRQFSRPLVNATYLWRRGRLCSHESRPERDEELQFEFFPRGTFGQQVQELQCVAQMSY